MRIRHPTFKLASCLAAALLFLGLALAGVWHTAAFAQDAGMPPPLDVTTVEGQASLAPYLAYLRDPGGQLAPADVEAPAAAARFTAFGATFPNFGFTSDAIWVRLSLTNPLAEPVPLILNIDVPTVSYVDLYRGTTGTRSATFRRHRCAPSLRLTPRARPHLCHPDRRTGGGNQPPTTGDSRPTSPSTCRPVCGSRRPLPPPQFVTKSAGESCWAC